MSETGPIPDTETCRHCGTRIIWLWSPRVNDGRGGWVMFHSVSWDGMSIRTHRCRPPSHAATEDPARRRPL